MKTASVVVVLSLVTIIFSPTMRSISMEQQQSSETDLPQQTLGNVYLQSGTYGISRGARESFLADTIPELIMNNEARGVWGVDLDCITKYEHLLLLLLRLKTSA